MKILMIAPTPFFADRGCHVRIFEEARSLRRIGHDVRIVTYHIGRDVPGIPTVRIPAVPWYRKLDAGPSWQKPFLDILLLQKAVTYSRIFRPDLLHAHLHEGGFVANVLKKFINKPVLLDCQGSLTGECISHGFFSEGSMLHSIFSNLEKWIIHGADAIITSSTAGAEELKKDWYVVPSKVTPVIDGVDTEFFMPHPRDEAREKLGISADSTVVVYLGLLNSYQGTDLLLETIAIMDTSAVPLHFLVMGFPESEYREKAESMGVSRRITFTGRVDYADAPLYLSAGDIAVSPKLSKTEANGKLFNYLACGLPTICFDTPVNREIMGDAAFYADYADPQSLATAINALAEDPERRLSLGLHARERAVAKCSVDARAAQIDSLYRILTDATG